ncbi:hypothetical protein GCM10027088_43710 [Nocardia goodfellowii]
MQRPPQSHKPARDRHEDENRRDRSAITGHFLKPDTNRRHTDTTVTENG